MKKILLIIAIALCIFQLVVLATAIDIGQPAIDRSGAWGPNYTYILKTNPANETGKITSIEIWANTDMSGVEVATFYVVSGTNFTTRDNEAISGTITAGSKVTKTVDLDVVTGDYIGLYWTGGNLEIGDAGGDWYYSGDGIPSTNRTFTSETGSGISLYGTGATTPTGWSHKWNTITIGKWNTATITKWNGIE